MEEAAPKIDARSAQDISRQLQKLLAAYASQSNYAPQVNWEKQLESKGLAAALVGIFSRFSELVIHRLNKTPEKNLLAYLDMLGLSALPPHPARAPLTFFLPAGGQTDALVPAGTQVAAKPAEGDAGPVVFETERELTVVAARLDAAFTRNPAGDNYSDHSLKLDSPDPKGAYIFTADAPIEHSLYFSHERFLSHPALKQLQLNFTGKQPFVTPITPSFNWELWDGTRWAEIPPKPAGRNTSPGANGFVEHGAKVFTTSDANVVILSGLPVVRPSEVGGRLGRWLRVRLATPLPPADFRAATDPRAQLPKLDGVSMTATLERPLDAAGGGGRLTAEAAFLNHVPVDTSKSFLPFGDKPRVGDALYLAQSEAFSTGGALVSLDIKVTRPAINPATEKEYPPPVVKLAWEFRDGRGWSPLFTSELTSDAKSVVKESVAGIAPTDDTQAFTKSGRVSFNLPAVPARTSVNGVESFWVRVRIVSGDYGKEAYYKLRKTTQTGGATNATTPDEYVLVPASFAPPTVDALAVGYSLTETEPPDAVVTFNDFHFKTVPRGVTFKPFETMEDTGVSFYMGFTLPGAPRPFPNRVVSLYVGLSGPLSALEEVSVTPSSLPRLNWEYWDGGAWSKLTVFDGTTDLTRTGILEFLAPPDFTPSKEFGLERFWVRVMRVSGQYRYEPLLTSLRLNTVMASQTLTVRDESLGSSDASADQKFTTTAAPVLAGQRLEVREHDRPSAEERARIEDEEGPDAVAVTLDETERPTEIWVRWHEVPDFYGSGPRDRHYVVNHLTGEFSFGDGRNGLIPPRGSGNLRLRFYQSGGGRVGNRPAGSITELKTTIPYIDGVTNAEPAAGGADAESRDSLIRRGPRSIRHRDRAVTVQDYEDLARLASPEVARVRCYPLQDLTEEFDQRRMKTGVVSLVVVPDSDDAKPSPSLELLDVVRNFLEPRRAVEVVRLVIVGPKYVRVTVSAEVVPKSPAAVGSLEANVADALSRFLHPLTGGAEGAGWSFGRTPHVSDIYAVIESVEGVGYVRSLKLDAVSEAKGTNTTPDSNAPADGQDYFLVYSGRHVIKLAFD